MDRLTAREREVLACVVEGHQNKHIAHMLNISLKTVTAHLTSVFASLGVTNRTQAAMWASGSIRDYVAMHPDGPSALAATDELVTQLIDRVDGLTAERDEAIRLLRGVVESDKQDAMMGHPNPGDSCISTYIGLVLMEWLDGKA